jgi:phosphoesterase RecJ-like protein
MDSDLEILEPPDELIEFIKSCSKFIIAGHKEPDGDCVGSQLALRSALLRMGKGAIACSAGPFKRTELNDYSTQFSAVPEDDKDAKVIIIDCASKERTGSIHDLLEKYPYAIIDHHAAVTYPESTKESPVYVDANAPSCTLLIYKLITTFGLEIIEEEAKYLFFGLCTDTGFFRHLTDKNARVFEVASKLISRGASPKVIFNEINGGKSLNSRILLGNVLSRTESHYDGRLLLSYETFDEFNYFGLQSRDSDTLNQMLLSVKGVEAVVIIRQEQTENCTVSLRSVDKVNVAKIAAHFCGGGHKNAAGLTMKGDIPFVKQKLLEYFSNTFTN